MDEYEGLRRFGRKVDKLAGKMRETRASSEAEKVKCDHAADVSMSAYDLLPEEDRDAIAWVREHGGLDAVREKWDGRVDVDVVSRMVEGHKAKRERLKAHALGLERKCAERGETIRELNKLKRAYIDALNGVCKRLGLTDGTGLPDMPEVIWTELDRRLMPEGMEWLVEAWPRFEDDAPLRFLDDFERYGEENGVSVVTMYSDGSFALNCRAYSKGEHVNRPASKVFDTDGAEIRVGDTVWLVDGGGPYTVKTTSGRLGTVEFEADEWTAAKPCAITHRAPVLAADGKPLREGETVWDKDSGDRLIVGAIEDGGHTVTCRYADLGDSAIPTHGSWSPCDLTHERPRDKCRDCAHWQKDPTADNMGVCWFLYHEYEGEDCYAARRGDCGACEEFMPRAKALAERGA